MIKNRPSVLSRLFSAVRDAVIAPTAPASVAGDYRLDSLEQRRLLSLVINGTPGDDSFIIHVINDKVHVNFNGNLEVFNAPSDGHVDVLGFAGNDNFWLRNNGGLRFTLFGFEGDDQFTIGQGDLFNDIRRDVVIADNVTNHPGTDSVIIDDSLGNTTKLTVDGTSVKILNVSLATIHTNLNPQDRVTLNCSTGNDTVEVKTLRPNTRINLGAGNDTIDFGGPDHIVEPSFGPGCVIDPGPGDDLMIIDDRSNLSHRTDISIRQVSTTPGQPRWMVLDNVGVLNPFSRMRIYTHALPDNQPQVVHFAGRDCPSHTVTIMGNDGPDKVLIGSFNDPIFAAELYTSEITLQLSSGKNEVEVNEDDNALGHSWALFEDRLQTGILTIRNQFGPVGPAGVTDILVRGTRFNDTFNIVKSPEFWNVTLAGGQGNDTLQQAPTLAPNGKFDLDAAFVGYVMFDGGSGDDSVILNDSQDQIGDFDHYRVSREGVFKGDFGDIATRVVLMSSVDRVTLVCDDDPNTIKFDLGGIAFADISGGGGDDYFINRADNQIPSNVMVNSLGAHAVLRGGAGNDRLDLDDGSGLDNGNYELAGGEFRYTRGMLLRRVQFESFSTLNVVGCGHANTAVIQSMPAGTTLNFTGGGGDDTFIVGGGWIDASNLHNATITGGSGNDQITFDDRLDDHFSTDNDTLILEFQRVAKDGVSILYGGFESQKVITSGVNNGPIAFPNTIRVDSIGIPTEILDTPGTRSTRVEVGRGPFGLSQVSAPLTLTSTDAMEVTIYDTLSTTNKQFVVGLDTITQNNSPGMTIHHSGLDGVSIIAGGTNDQLIVQSVPAGQVVFFNGGAGDDSVSIGNGTFGQILGAVHFSGGTGTDKLIASNLFDFAGDPMNVTLTAGSLRVDSGPLHQFFNGVEQVLLGISSGGGTNFNIHSSPASVTINGGTGDDHVFVRNLLNHVTFNGGAEIGADSIIIDDSAATANDSYTFDTGGTLRKNTTGPLVTVNGVERQELRAGSGHNQIQVNSTSLDLHLFGNAGNDTIIVNDSTGFVTVDTGSEVPAINPPVGDSLSVNIDNTQPGDIPSFVRIVQDDTVCLLQVGAGGVLRIENGAVLNKAPTPFAIPTLLRGTIDLAEGALLFRDEGLDIPVRQWITAGRNGGSWNGQSANGAITSSFASASPLADGVGYGRGSEIGVPRIGSFVVNPADWVVRYTLDGDADLDGAVNITDFSRVAAGFNISNPAWTAGDFNYDGRIDIADFASVAGNFNKTVSVLSRNGNPMVEVMELLDGNAPR